MIGNSLLTQVGMAAIAIGIVITYIQPTLGEISERQDEIVKTVEEKNNITTVNNKLASLYSQVSAISPSDKVSLYTYLPDQVDEVKVLKDLTSIAKDANLVVNSLTYTGNQENVSSSRNNSTVGSLDKPNVSSFEISFLSSYEQIKDFLLRLEQNNYPLDISTLNISATEGGFLETNATIITYSHKE